MDAIDLVARYGRLLLPEYPFDPYRGLWHHHGGIIEPPLRAGPAALRRRGAAALPVPARACGRNELAEYLAYGRVLFAKLAAEPEDALAEDGSRIQLTTGVEELRWFDLPDVCLVR